MRSSQRRRNTHAPIAPRDNPWAGKRDFMSDLARSVSSDDEMANVIVEMLKQIRDEHSKADNDIQP